ncbi:glucose-6-phosphate dehydrogenase [Bacillus fonticola]|uniref:glucose-6-phosphate dehydrogenase n=1 Tax=Bacillus fonticola TaxID=2728853 RepID=UPI0014740A42|nr:glucose-6-phosphate dehydrogenase [Bacillus fonticola]
MSNQETPSVLLTIFGATGDLASRKLFPSLYNLYQKGHLSKNFACVGVARRNLTQEEFRQRVQDSIGEDAEALQPFLDRFSYHSHDVADRSSYKALKQITDELDDRYHIGGNRIFYLAMAPEFFGTIAEHLKQDGLKSSDGFNRLVIEKPFGHNLPSAKELNDHIRESFNEEEIYRIDHYLGKEMVQNIEVIRFANALFEPLWNNRHISNIQITLAEELGVEERGGYYEKSGAIRDMVQNHILQMVSLLAMEPPIRLTTDEIRSEKVKALRALRSLRTEEVRDSFVRGQYDAGEIRANAVPAYRDEDHVDTDSNTETFVAGKLTIDNFRWAGVPFYIRTGKRMQAKSTKIVVQFKDIPMNLYAEQGETLNPNLLIIHIQPDEGITLHLNAKKSGESLETTPVKLNAANTAPTGINTPEAYEKLLFDCMRGDATNFTHWDEVALSWQFVDKISSVWEAEKESFPNYKAGTPGPVVADELLERDGFHWWDIESLELKDC